MRVLLAVIMLFLTSFSGAELTKTKATAQKVTEMKKVVVLAMSNDANEEKSIEDAVVKRLTGTKMQGISYLSLFPEQRKYGKKETDALQAKEGIDGTLSIIKADEKQIKTKFSSYLCNESMRSCDVDPFGVPKAPQYEVPKNIYKFKVVLLDVDEKDVWKANLNISTEKNKGPDDALAKAVVKKLKAEGIIKK